MHLLANPKISLTLADSGGCTLCGKLASKVEDVNGMLAAVAVQTEVRSLCCFMQVYGLPTLVMFRDGKVLDGSQREGAISEPELRKYLGKWEVAKA